MRILKWFDSSSWESSRNGGVVRIWHNPVGIPIPTTEWMKLAKKLRSSAKARLVSTIMREQPARRKELSHCVFHTEDYDLTVIACLEQLKNGGLLKHAMIRIPNNNITKGMPQVFARVALAIEPLEPAFTATYNDGDIVYYNLFWPIDWQRAHEDLSFQAFPIWDPPIRIQPPRQLVLWPGFDKKMIASGLAETYATMMLNLGLVSIVLEYLDLQKSGDLVLLQGAQKGGPFEGRIPSTLDKTFGTLLFQMMRHRLGPCKTCGHVVCKDYSIDPTPTHQWQDTPGRKTKIVHIWPISAGCLFGIFTYTCVQCRSDIVEDVFLLGLDVKLQLPDIAAFMQPFADFVGKS